MSGPRAALKAIKALLDSQQYEAATAEAKKLLEGDPRNYHANVFLGLAYDKLNRDEEAAKAYNTAAEIKEQDTLVWQGLINLYEKQGDQKLAEYEKAAVKLAEIYGDLDDKHRCQETIDKYILSAKKWGSQSQYQQALHVILPGSPVYEVLEGRIPHPSHTYLRLAEISETEEKQFVNKEIGERRTRLGARVDQVTSEVKVEAFARFGLEQLYQNVIDWSNDDETRRMYEEKLLQRVYDTLLVLPANQKSEKRAQVEKLARDMVIIKHPFQHAWTITLEWHDAENLSDFDVGILRDYIEFFPASGLSKVLQGYLETEICPFSRRGSLAEGDESDAENVLGAEDRLISMVEGLEGSPSSVLSHRIMGDYYLFLNEFQSAVEVGRNAQELAKQLTRDIGVALQDTKDSIDITLANALISHQSPRHHPEAKSLFENILERKPKLTAALLGVGLVLAEDEDYPDAIQFLSQALERDGGNAKIRSELAWCKALNGEYESGIQDLQASLDAVHATGTRDRIMEAQLLYRIGYCQWYLDSSKSARRNRTGAYANFLAALQANINFAPAYTMLGIFYADYAKDKKRARKCFQKAFELSPSEIEAANRLAISFADQGEWDLVEVCAQRVVDSGKARPAPGSKKKAFSWPFAALGVVHLNRQEYMKSIVSLQAALRLSPEDYHSWVGLGESYYSSGRYIAATKAFKQAESLETKLALDPKQTWFAKFMLSNVKRELGQYEEAIDGYNAILLSNPQETGAQIALLQTMTESAWRNVELGLFGEAVACAITAIEVAVKIAEYHINVFNLWKAVGDACSIFSWVQSRESDLPISDLQTLLKKDIQTVDYNIIADIDGIGEHSLLTLPTEQLVAQWSMVIAILAQKRAILSSSQDVHAQAVAWYNLGWTEFNAQSQGGTSPKLKAFLRAAVKCFKRAIELEASNAEFWNALGVATTTLNPKVAQHAFVRSLHLNERSGRVWTNLAVLYLLQNDHQLANDAFTRAQSADPDYAQAWLGQGLLALLFGDAKEARFLFTHAFDISSSSSMIAKRQYAMSAFDLLVQAPASNELAQLIQPLFALQQLRSQRTADLPCQHLLSLFQERVGNLADANLTLQSVCSLLESEFEVSESQEALSRFAQAQADYARIRLGRQDYDGAAESAQKALDLSDEEDGLNPEARRKWRLSAHLTAGLSFYFQKLTNQAIEMFGKALEESNNAPDVVCLLAQVLWAKGGEDERNFAREKLFDCVEEHPDHVGAVTLLGVIALLDSDDDAIEAVESDLNSMRTREDLDIHTRSRVAQVLAGIASSRISKANPGSQEELLMYEATRSVMIAPAQPQGWSELAAAASNPQAAQMALKTSLKAVPPNGSLDATDLSKAYSHTGSAGDAERAIMFAPWMNIGWEELSESLTGVTIGAG